MREPSFWWGEAGIASSLLAPLAMVYGAVAGRRIGAPGRRAGTYGFEIGILQRSIERHPLTPRLYANKLYDPNTDNTTQSIAGERFCAQL